MTNHDEHETETARTARVLVVEDDAMTARWVCETLRGAGYDPRAIDHGEDGIILAEAWQPALLLLDLGLPGVGGLAVVRALRARLLAMPIIVFTASVDDASIVDALDAGADDYLAKPVTAPVLLARVRAALRRGGGAHGHVLRVGTLTLDRIAGRTSVRHDGVEHELGLTPRERRLLEHFLLREGETISRSELHETVWEMRFDPGTNVVDATVSRLRTKLAACPGAPSIDAVRGVGYRLG